MGGAAVLCAYLAGLGMTMALGVFPWAARSDTLRAVGGFIAGGVLIALVGVMDDVRGIGAKRKLLGQVAAVTVAFASGARIEGFTLPHMGFVALSGPVSYALTLVWILAFINALNLIDGLDGLAGGVAFFAALTNLVISLVNGNALVAVLHAALAGSILGFLFYNFNPATVFLGDTGSLFLGYVLGATALLGGRQKEGALVSLLVPVLALGLPLTDTLLAMARRVLERRSVFSPDRGHIHHKLLDLGVTHRRAVLILYTCTALLCAAAMGVAFGRAWQVGAALLFAVLTLIGIVRFAGAFELARLQRLERATLLSPAAEALYRALPDFLVQVRQADSQGRVWAALEALLACGSFAFAEYVPVPDARPAWRWQLEADAVPSLGERTSLLEFALRDPGTPVGPRLLRFGYRSDKWEVPPEVKVLLRLGVDAVDHGLACLPLRPHLEAEEPAPLHGVLGSTSALGASR
jgi:UDP-GlcNAc:undecaprenyl-phosphate/decaprenyl-phosphate GlcNAc-1-phosphate transferase